MPNIGIMEEMPYTVPVRVDAWSPGVASRFICLFGDKNQRHSSFVEALKNEKEGFRIYNEPVKKMQNSYTKRSQFPVAKLKYRFKTEKCE